jgi:hypothetical protein
VLEAAAGGVAAETARDSEVTTVDRAPAHPPPAACTALAPQLALPPAATLFPAALAALQPPLGGTNSRWPPRARPVGACRLCRWLHYAPRVV